MVSSSRDGGLAEEGGHGSCLKRPRSDSSSSGGHTRPHHRKNTHELRQRFDMKVSPRVSGFDKLVAYRIQNIGELCLPSPPHAKTDLPQCFDVDTSVWCPYGGTLTSMSVSSSSGASPITPSTAAAGASLHPSILRALSEKKALTVVAGHADAQLRMSDAGLMLGRFGKGEEEADVVVVPSTCRMFTVVWGCFCDSLPLSEGKKVDLFVVMGKGLLIRGHPHQDLQRHHDMDADRALHINTSVEVWTEGEATNTPTDFRHRGRDSAGGRGERVARSEGRNRRSRSPRRDRSRSREPYGGDAPWRYHDHEDSRRNHITQMNPLERSRERSPLSHRQHPSERSTPKFSTDHNDDRASEGPLRGEEGLPAGVVSSGLAHNSCIFGARCIRSRNGECKLKHEGNPGYIPPHRIHCRYGSGCRFLSNGEKCAYFHTDEEVARARVALERRGITLPEHQNVRGGDVEGQGRARGERHDEYAYRRDDDYHYHSEGGTAEGHGDHHRQWHLAHGQREDTHGHVHMHQPPHLHIDTLPDLCRSVETSRTHSEAPSLPTWSPHVRGDGGYVVYADGGIEMDRMRRSPHGDW